MATDTLDVGTTLAPISSFTQTLLSFSADFFAFIVVVILVAVFAFVYGSDRFLPLIAALYAAIPLFIAFPYKEILQGNPYFIIGLYVALVVLGVIAFSGLSSFMASSGLGTLRTVVLSILTAGLLLVVAIHVLPVEEIYTFSTPTKALFSSEAAFFWWLAAPLAGLFFLGRG